MTTAQRQCTVQQPQLKRPLRLNGLRENLDKTRNSFRRKSNFELKTMKILKVPEFVSTKVFTVISHMLLELGNNTLK
jgi:hypothetical protein